MNRRFGTLLLAALTSSLAPAGPALAGPLDPTAYASLGTLNLTSGTYSFVVSSSGAPVLAQYDGFSYTTLYTGTVSAGGVNVFDFGSVTIGAGVTISASNGGGAGPIALLSRGGETIAGTIDVSGASGTYSSTVPQPGPGAGGGNAGGAGNTYNTGTGGTGGFITTGGGGGGFAGTGQSANGRTYGPTYIAGGQGGAGAAINLASILQGGSNGGNAGSAIGGGGGGAIELGASEAIVIAGSILANGGGGGTVQFGSGAGGGSGGGIFIHADALNITGTLSALGGAAGVSGGGTGEAGGGGGGGAILLQASIPGGYSGSPTVYVGNGQFASPSTQAVPEPSSLILLGTSCLGLIGASILRGRRARG